MIKELEALNDLWKRLEEVNQPMINDYEFIKSALERNEKLEKAWEIIKKKCVNFTIMIQVGIAEDYNSEVDIYNRYNGQAIMEHLTETEFNLLKEMLK